MAYPCVLNLKNECDGCGFCDEPRYGLSRARDPFSDDVYDPFEIEHDDERR